MAETISLKILILVDYFVPGFKAGGPIQSIRYIVDHLNKEFDLRIVTRDRDMGDSHSYMISSLIFYLIIYQASLNIFLLRRLSFHIFFHVSYSATMICFI